MHRNSSLSCYSILKIAKIAKKIRKPPFSGLFDFHFSKVVDILKKKTNFNFGPPEKRGILTKK